MAFSMKAFTSSYGPMGKLKKDFDDMFKGALGDKEGGDEEKKEGEEAEEDPEITEARREAEEKRREKHRKAEEEREDMRQSIRDKYGIKKKEEVKPEEDLGMDGRLGRKKKTAAEFAAEANQDEEEDEFSNSGFPKNLDELKTKVTALPGTVMTQVTEAKEKCCVQ